MFRLAFLTLMSVTCFSAAEAQVIMLPTQQQFGYRGSVLVPDGGSVYLGGNRRYATGSSQRGWLPFGSSRGSAIGNSGLSISATIIDHQEIDRQLLGGTPEEFMRRERQREAAAAAPVGNAHNQSLPVEEGKALVRYARQLYLEGEIERSKAAYRMAFPLLTPELRTLALSEFKRRY